MNYRGYTRHQESLAIVPSLSRTPRSIPLKVCPGYRNRSDTIYVSLFDDKTLYEVKEEICKRLSLTRTPADFSLARYDEKECIWIFISDANNYKTIAELNLHSCTILNIERHEELASTEQHTLTIHEKDFILKLCRQPMRKLDFDYLSIHSTATIRYLKEEARKRAISQKNEHLYWWTNDGWTELEITIDDLTLVQMGFDQHSFISFGTVEDTVPGLCGLTNLGSTCFMNSALQCLSNVPAFTRQILSFGNENDAPIIGAYSTLIQTMWSGKHAVTTPSSLLLNIRENLPLFARYRQQDAQEFMNCFLHSIHREFTGDRSLITDLFFGRVKSSVRCLGGCCCTETTDEIISFLPLPIANNIEQYDILYLRSNGEQQILPISSCAKTIGALIQSFIERHDPSLSPQHVRAVGISNNEIRDDYLSETPLTERIKRGLTFIEVLKRTVEEKYVTLQFHDRRTRQPFRPPVLVVSPSYCCRYSDLSKQIDRIKKHLCSTIKAPDSALTLFRINYTGEFFQLNTDETSLLINRLMIEMDSPWVQKYTNQFDSTQTSINPTLNSLLADFFREELLNGDYHCSKCLGLKQAKQKTDFILPLPPVLTIQLKRFTYDAYSDTKIDTFINFPIRSLDLRSYILEAERNQSDISALYDLVAVSNHTGTLASGHYVTYAKNDRTKGWYSFNDENIREIKDENTIVTKNAYILVYIKQTTE